MAQFKAVVRLPQPGIPAQTYFIEAWNRPAAIQQAQCRTGGEVLSCNQVGGG
jgi:hypothetical protein